MRKTHSSADFLEITVDERRLGTARCKKSIKIKDFYYYF